MSYSSGGFHSHTIGKTLLFLNVLKSQPQEFPLEKQAPSPSPGKIKQNSKENHFWMGLLALDGHTQCTRVLFEAPSNWASPGSGELPGSVRPSGLRRAARPSSALAAGGEGIPRPPQEPGRTSRNGCHPSRSPALARGGFEGATGRSLQGF